MSVQTTSGRHRALRTRERWQWLRSLLRHSAPLRTQLTTLPKAGAAYVAELLRPTGAESVRAGQLRTLHLGRASIGYYAPVYVAAAPRLRDEVVITWYPNVPEYVDLVGVVVEIARTPRGLAVEVPNVGTLSCEPRWLQLVDRDLERTLTMRPILAEAAVGGAW